MVNKPAIAATCVFLACRLVGCPRLAEEIAAGCSSHSFFTQASSHRQQPLQQPSLSSSALAVIDVSTLHRMQTELLKALQIAPRITKSADLFLRLSSRVLQEISGLQHQHQQRQQRQQQQFRQEASQPQRHISLSYATLEEGVSLCERIASFEVLPEHTPPQTIVAAVLVWLLVLLPEVADRPADHRSSSSLAATSATTCTTVTSPAHSSPTSDGNDKSSAVNVSAPPLENVGAFWSLPTIASHCYTSVKAVKDLVGRLHSALPILFLCNDNPGHNEAAGDNSTRARLAKAYEQFNVSLAAQSLQLSQPSHSLLKENVTQDDTDNTSHINSTNKRKRGNNHSGGSSSSFQVDCIIDPVTHSLHSPLWLLPVAPSSTKGRAPSSHPANAASVFPIPPSFASSAIGSNNCSSSGSSHAKSVVSMSAETPSVGVPKTPSTQSLCSQTTETSFQSESNNDNGNLRSSFGSNHQSRLFAKRAQEIARQSQGLFAPERKRLRYS